MNLPTKEKFLKDLIIQTLKDAKNLCIADATCGNGYDTLFLATNFPNTQIHAIDIQQEAINNTKDLCKNFTNINYHNQSHLDFFKKSPYTFDFIIFNTGFLPNSSSNVVTQAKITIKTLQEALVKLTKGGFIAITLYQGHDNGQEHKNVKQYLKTLDKYQFIVFTYQTINTINSPNLYLIEKK